MLCGKFAALLELYTSDGRKRKDVDNRTKAVLDFAVRVGLIKDDSHCEKVTSMWVKADGAPQYGCRLTLWDYGE